MAQISSTTFKSNTTTLYADNTTGNIGADDLRTQMDNTADSVIFKVTGKVAPPVIGDDSAGTAGNGAFLVGDMWIDETNNKSYISVDSSAGAAVWIEITIPDIPTFQSINIEGSTPILTLLDTDGTNTFARIQNIAGATYIDSRNDTANGPILFRGTSGGGQTEYARFDSLGKLGVGITTMDTPLHISDGTATGIHNVATFAGGSGGGLSSIGDEARIIITTNPNFGNVRGAWLSAINSSGATQAHDLLFYTNADSVPPVENMRLDRNGNVTLTGTVEGRDIAIDGAKLDLLDQGLATTDSPTFVDPMVDHVVISAAATNGGLYMDATDSVMLIGGGSNSLNSGINISLAGPDNLAAEKYKLRNGTANIAIYTGAQWQWFIEGVEIIKGTATNVEITGDIIATGATPRMDFIETDAAIADTTRLVQDGSTFRIQTVDAGTFIAEDYAIDKNATGPIAHRWNIQAGEAMRINSDGDLNVLNNILFAAVNFGLKYTAGKLALQQTSSSASAVALESLGDVEISSDTNNSTDGDIVFNTSGTQRAVIKRTTGRLGIGTDDPDGALDVRGVGYFTAGSSSTLLLNRTGSTGGTVFFQSNGSTAGTISVTGSATSYNTSSDYRLKENWVPIQGALDIINALNPYTYTFKSDGSWQDGMLAHEVQDIYPRAATGSKDAMMDEEYEVTPEVLGDNGEIVTEAVMGTRSVPDYQGIDYSQFTPVLIAGQQALYQENVALKAAMLALEARLTAAGL
jgi:hypothetical protein